MFGDRDKECKETYNKLKDSIINDLKETYEDAGRSNAADEAKNDFAKIYKKETKKYAEHVTGLFGAFYERFGDVPYFTDKIKKESDKTIFSSIYEKIKDTVDSFDLDDHPLLESVAHSRWQPYGLYISSIDAGDSRKKAAAKAGIMIAGGVGAIYFVINAPDNIIPYILEHLPKFGGDGGTPPSPTPGVSPSVTPVPLDAGGGLGATVGGVGDTNISFADIEGMNVVDVVKNMQNNQIVAAAGANGGEYGHNHIVNLINGTPTNVSTETTWKAIVNASGNNPPTQGVADLLIVKGGG